MFENCNFLYNDARGIVELGLEELEFGPKYSAFLLN